MSILNTYTCDGTGCSAIKKETDRWWTVVEGIEELEGINQIPTMLLKPLVGKTSNPTFCGIECLQKYSSQWMAKIQATIQEPKQS